MAFNNLLHVLFTFALLFSSTTLSLEATEGPETSPSPAPESGADDSPAFPSPSPSVDFPYMSPPADLAPTLASSPSLGMSPVPQPENASDTTTANVQSDKPKNSTFRGMSGGAKAGIAIGVIAAACVVGFGGLLYKKRKENVHRARLAYAARTDFI